MNRATPLFAALIRAHHITSRKKVSKLKKAASNLDVKFVLLRSGSSPGIMYVESAEEAHVANWVATVQALRYKDYQLVQRPTRFEIASENLKLQTGFHEVASVAEFGDNMKERGLLKWWRVGLGYAEQDDKG